MQAVLVTLRQGDIKVGVEDQRCTAHDLEGERTSREGRADGKGRDLELQGLRIDLVGVHRRKTDLEICVAGERSLHPLRVALAVLSKVIADAAAGHILDADTGDAAVNRSRSRRSRGAELSGEGHGDADASHCHILGDCSHIGGRSVVR